MRGRRSIWLHIDQAVVDGGRGRGGGGGSGRARSVLIVLFLLRIPGRRCFLIRHRDPADGQLDEVESGVCVGDEGGQAGAFLAGGGGAWVWKRRLSFFFFSACALPPFHLSLYLHSPPASRPSTARYRARASASDEHWAASMPWTKVPARMEAAAAARPSGRGRARATPALRRRWVFTLPPRTPTPAGAWRRRGGICRKGCVRLPRGALVCVCVWAPARASRTKKSFTKSETGAFIFR